MEKIIFAITTIEAILIIVLKILNMYYKKRIENLKKIQLEAFEEKHLLSPDVSYEKYKKISKRTSVGNHPVRIEGDYFDYIFSDVARDSKLIENNIMKISCEDVYE